MPVIEARELVRTFGDFTAVDGVSFEIAEGELFGFLGPNGAGKTTTINMLCTLLKPTSGGAIVAGHDIVTEQAKVRDCIGLIFQDPTLDDRLTGTQNLRFHAMLYDVREAVFRKRSAELLDMVELTEKAGEKVRTYSGGMKRRLEIVRGLLHHPQVLFLDEPTIGLDPQTRRHIWDYLQRLRGRENVTLFLTTHYMDEAEVCDRIAIIDNGRIIALDSPAGLKAMVGGDVVTLRTTDDERAVAVLKTACGVEARSGPDGGLIVETAAGDRLIPQVIQSFSASDPPIDVTTVNLSHPTLEDVFIKLTGRAIRDEGADATSGMRQRIRAGARSGRGGGPHP